MTKKTIINSVIRAFRSKSTKKISIYSALFAFLALVCAGLLLRSLEVDHREKTALNIAKAIADTALADPTIGLDEIILKVSDLFLVESVLGVKLIDGRNVPLSVGQTSDNFPDLTIPLPEQILWHGSGAELDIALKLAGPVPFDWFVMRLDGRDILQTTLYGTLVSWVVAPLTALLVFIISLYFTGKYFKFPQDELDFYFKEHEGAFYKKEMPPTLLKRDDQWGKMSHTIELSRRAFKDEKFKLETQVGFLNETPYPLLRCSVNRKVLFANSAARILSPLFGDDTKEFVSPALSEIVRKAFYDTKEIHADIRLGQYIMTFRAIPVLDSGYVNLYGEHSRKANE